MADHSAPGRDTGAAFAGLIGGAILIAIILYTIFMLTDKKFEGHSKAPGSTHALVSVEALPRA